MRRGILAHANQVTFPTLYSLAGRLSLQWIKFARKEKWKKNCWFWQSAEFV